MKIIAGELSVIPTKEVDITLKQILDEFTKINQNELNSFFEERYFTGFSFLSSQEQVKEDYIINRELEIFYTRGIFADEKFLLSFSNEDNFDDFFTAIDYLSDNCFFSEDLLDELSSKAQMLNEKYDFKFRHGSSRVGLLCFTLVLCIANLTEGVINTAILNIENIGSGNYLPNQWLEIIKDIILDYNT
ncbi:hypothetical protein [Aquimarina sp. 2304DJ70-9]|uniref:hypothetical protein n=1 Tax=Aquimarina penaris TaxID=3231044 RepID=UPI00346238F1